MSNPKFKIGDKFVLVRSGDPKLDGLFFRDVWGKVFEVEGLGLFGSDWGRVYHTKNDELGVVEPVMVSEDIYNSPLYQALK